MQKSLVALCFLILPLASFAQEPHDVSTREARMHRRAWPVTKNIFSFNPVHITEDNVGVGLSLEHFLDDKGMVSAYFPFSLAFSQNENNYYYYGHFYYYPLETSRIRTRGMAYFYPGIKAYPFGAFKKMSFAVGANLVAGFGRADEITAHYKVDTINNAGNISYNYIMTNETTESLSRFKLGALMTSSVNIRPTQHFYMAVEAGVGYSYIDKLGNNNDREFLAQIGLKIGYAR